MERYFDANATTPLRPEARAAWIEAIDEYWHNPSSPYRSAARTHARLEAARETVAGLLGVRAETVVFNSGATEGNRDVLAYWRAIAGNDARVAVSAVEHPAVLENARQVWGDRLARMPVDSQGRAPVEEIASAVERGASLVSLMAANNETGAHQPWREALAICRERRAALHIDATQWLGREPLAGLGEADFVTASGHKFGGPKGVGFVIVSPGFSGFHGQKGGVQENAHRAGTENFPAIAGLAAALAGAEREREAAADRCRAGRDAFEAALRERIPGLRIWAAGANRLPNTSSLLLPAGTNERWVRLLDQRGFAVSTGSACATGKTGPSHVLAAMGAGADEARRTVRVSSLMEASEADWRALTEAFVAVCQEVGESSGKSQIIEL